MNNENSIDLSSYYQKQYDSNNQIVGVEVLMKPKNTSIVKVVKILELKNKINALDFIALNSAIKLAEQYSVSCSSNISSKTLNSESNCQVIQLLDPERKITLEITETSTISDAAINNIKYLADLGYKFSLDDYGRKFNNIYRIIQLPIKEIKLDKQIVNCFDTRKGRIIIEHTIQLASSLGCSLIFEGVETEEQLKALIILGAKYFQGYYFHKPESIESFTIEN